MIISNINKKLNIESSIKRELIININAFKRKKKLARVLIYIYIFTIFIIKLVLHFIENENYDQD